MKVVSGDCDRHNEEGTFGIWIWNLESCTNNFNWNLNCAKTWKLSNIHMAVWILVYIEHAIAVLLLPLHCCHVYFYAYANELIVSENSFGHWTFTLSVITPVKIPIIPH